MKGTSGNVLACVLIQNALPTMFLRQSTLYVAVLPCQDAVVITADPYSKHQDSISCVTLNPV